MLFKLAIRNVIRQKRRTFLTVCSIAVGIWSCLALASLGRGIGRQVSSDSIKTFLGHVQIHQPEFLSNPVIEHRFQWPNPELISAIEQYEKTLHYSARLRVPGIAMSERSSAGITILGVDPKSELLLSFLKEARIDGRFLVDENDPGIVIGQKLASKLKTSIGKRLVLMGENVNHVVSDRGFKVVGIFHAEVESTEKMFLLAGRKVIQDLFLAPDQITEISILLADKEDVSPLLQKLMAITPQLEAKAWDDIQPMVKALLNLQDGFILLWFGIVVVAVVFALINTIFMAIMERIKEIGVMLALGFRPKALVQLICLESLILLLIGIIIGNLLTYSSNYFLRDGIDLTAFAKGVEVFGSASIVYPTPLFKDIFLANLLVVLCGVLGSVYPAWRAAALDPIVAIREE